MKKNFKVCTEKLKLPITLNKLANNLLNDGIFILYTQSPKCVFKEWLNRKNKS